MGVEYAHFFVVADLSWIGRPADALRVHQVLEKWSLVSEPPVIYDRNGGRRLKLQKPLSSLTTTPQNLQVVYPSVMDVPSIPRIMGPSFYPEESIGERYIQGITLTMGTDFHIHDSTDAYSVDVLAPPEDGGTPVKPYPRDSLVYPATPSSKPPRIHVSVERPQYRKLVPDGFSGVWRSALELDCGKDLPAMIEKTPNVPGRQFAADLEKAFGTRLLQIGRIY